MDRTIRLDDVKAAVKAAYENNKALDEGTVDAAYGNADPKDFGVVVALTDGTVIAHGDTKKPFVLGALAKIGLVTELLTENGGADKAAGKTGCCCCCDKSKPKPDVPVSVRGVRAVSAVEPAGDREGKMMVLTDRLTSLAGTEPGFDDAVYKARAKANADADVVNKFAEADVTLYDDTELSVDIFTRLESQTLTAEQLAAVGATIAADGYNPVAKQNAFDGKLARQVVAFMAVHGLHKMNKRWLMQTGLPAKAGRGGGLLAVLPGVMAVAAYSPRLNDKGVSVKAAAAVAEIASRLDLSVFASAKVKVEK